MIEADVLVEFKSWNKIIQSPQRQISNILKKFPKRYKFIYKKVHLTVLLTNTNEIKILNKKNKNIKLFLQNICQKYDFFVFLAPSAPILHHQKIRISYPPSAVKLCVNFIMPEFGLY